MRQDYRACPFDAPGENTLREGEAEALPFCPEAEVLK